MRWVRAAVVVLVFSSSGAASLAQRPLPITNMDAASEVLQSETGDRAKAALDYVLGNLNMARADVLLIASMNAMQTKGISDAAFLFYAAQMRSRIDHQRFPPVGKGGSDPAVALGALQQVIGGEINPAVMREPVTFGAVLDRLDAWSAETGAGYQPGWPYTTALPAAEATKITQTVKAEYMRGGRSVLSLVKNPEYLAALRESQAAAEADMSDDAKLKAAEERYRRAQERMCAIEKQMKVEGMCGPQPQ